MGKAIPKKQCLYQQLRDGEVTVDEIPEGTTLNSNALKSTTASRKNKDRVQFGTQGQPSKAQLALLERYKIDKNKDVIANTLDGVVSDSILQIQETVNNMVNYKDAKVFKVLPKELNDTIQAYGMFAQEYFGRKVKELDGMPVYVIPNTYKQCGNCGTFKHAEDCFYISKSKMYNGRVPICKDCCIKMFNEYFAIYKDIRETIILMSQKLDLFVYEPTLTKYVELYDTPYGKEQVANNIFFGNYIGELIVSLNINKVLDEECCFAKSNLNGIPFKSVAKIFNMPPIYNDIIATSEQESISDDDSKYSAQQIKKLKLYWGDYEMDELKWLENKKSYWYECYDIQGYSVEMLVQQMCFDEFSIWKGRQAGKDVSKAFKNLQAALKDSNLSPKKQSIVTSESQFASLTEFIKHAEKNKPIISKNPQFVDVDGIRKIWKSIVGTLSRTMGRDNEYVKYFEEAYKEHSIDMDTVDDSKEVQPNDKK